MALVAMREVKARAYAGAAKTLAVYTTASAGTPGTEPGSPYARKPITWVLGGDDGVVTASVTLDMPAGVTARSIGVLGAGGEYLDHAPLTPEQGFTAAGQLVVNLTMTETA